MNEPVPDYPDADGTDNAHPAWWRGCDAGAQMTVEWVHRVLDDIQSGTEPKGTCGSNALNMLRDRLYNEFRRKQ